MKKSKFNQVGVKVTLDEEIKLINTIPHIGDTPALPHFIDPTDRNPYPQA